MGQVSRTALGRVVQEAWIQWAYDQAEAKESWFVPYDDLSPSHQEVANLIGEAVANYLQLEAGVRYSVVPSDPNVRAVGLPWTVAMIDPRENLAAFKLEAEAMAYARHMNGQEPISLGKTTEEKAVQTMSTGQSASVVVSKPELSLVEKVAAAQAAAAKP